MRAYVIADLHIGTDSIVMEPPCLARLRQRLIDHPADVIVLGGDVWSAKVRPAELCIAASLPLFDVFDALDPRPDLVWIPGNHDFLIADEFDAMRARFAQLRRVGVAVSGCHALTASVAVVHGYEYEQSWFEPEADWAGRYRALNVEMARRTRRGEPIAELSELLACPPAFRDRWLSDDWVLEHLNAACDRRGLPAECHVIFGHTHRRVAGRRVPGPSVPRTFWNPGAWVWPHRDNRFVDAARPGAVACVETGTGVSIAIVDLLSDLGTAQITALTAHRTSHHFPL